MNKKVLGITVVLMAIAMLVAPVMADPTQGQKTAVTVNIAGGPPTDIDPPVTTGPVTHKYQEQFMHTVTITFEDGSTLDGTATVERKVVYVPQHGAMRWIFTDYYEFDFGEGGFVGNGKTILDGVVFTATGISWQASLAYGLFHGTGEFEGQTLNIGHTWGEPGSEQSAWTGYWLKCSVYP